MYNIENKSAYLRINIESFPDDIHEHERFAESLSTDVQNEVRQTEVDKLLVVLSENPPNFLVKPIITSYRRALTKGVTRAAIVKTGEQSQMLHSLPMLYSIYGSIKLFSDQAAAAEWLLS